MRHLFGNIDTNNVIQKLPIDFEVIDKSDFKAIRTSDTLEVSKLIPYAITSGITGYWDESNFIVVASPEYSFVIDKLTELIVPDHCILSTNTLGGFMGVNLLMLAC